MKRKRIVKPGILRFATRYPWKRNFKGDLCGADGQPIYFRGVDAVLVEHSPAIAEALVIIHALTEHRTDSRRALRSIAAHSARVLAQMEKRYGDRWCQGSIS